MILTGKMTTKGQLTVPKEIRDQLGLDAGVELVFFVDGSGLRIEKAKPFDVAWHRFTQASMAEEWDSPEDEEAFRDLQAL